MNSPQFARRNRVKWASAASGLASSPFSFRACSEGMSARLAAREGGLPRRDIRPRH
jgi:hypothetical protein